jgi:hypothetical protein
VIVLESLLIPISLVQARERRIHGTDSWHAQVAEADKGRSKFWAKCSNTARFCANADSGVQLNQGDTAALPGFTAAYEYAVYTKPISPGEDACR